MGVQRDTQRQRGGGERRGSVVQEAESSPDGGVAEQMGQKDRDTQRQRDKNKRSAQGREGRQEVSANTEPTETGGGGEIHTEQ